MARIYERELLTELEAKLDAVQNRLDYMLSECYTPLEMQSTESEYYRLMDRINDLKIELNIKD